MKTWPVPNSYSQTLPEQGAAGAFWEDRGDRRHCGVDIYAPEGSDVIAVASGQVIDVGVFSSPELVPYWNITYYILIQQQDGFISKYAELQDVVVAVGESVQSGQVIGRVGSVLNPDKISSDAPPYVRELEHCGHLSMLHFELYRDPPVKPESYLGGNIFDHVKPHNLLDATAYLAVADLGLDGD